MECTRPVIAAAVAVAALCTVAAGVGVMAVGIMTVGAPATAPDPAVSADPVTTVRASGPFARESVRASNRAW